MRQSINIDKSLIKIDLSLLQLIQVEKRQNSQDKWGKWQIVEKCRSVGHYHNNLLNCRSAEVQKCRSADVQETINHKSLLKFIEIDKFT